MSSPSTLIPPSITQPLASLCVQKPVLSTGSLQVQVGLPLTLFQDQGSPLLLQIQAQRSPTGSSSLTKKGLGMRLRLEGCKAEVPAAQPGQYRELTDRCSALTTPRGALVVSKFSAVSSFRQGCPNGITLFWSALCRLLSGSSVCTHMTCLVPESLLYFPFATPIYNTQWFAISDLSQDSWKNSSSQLVFTSLVMPSAATPVSQEPFYFSFLIKKSPNLFCVLATFSQIEYLSHIEYIPLLFSSSSLKG